MERLDFPRGPGEDAGVLEAHEAFYPTAQVLIAPWAVSVSRAWLRARLSRSGHSPFTVARLPSSPPTGAPLPLRGAVPLQVLGHGPSEYACDAEMPLEREVSNGVV